MDDSGESQALLMKEFISENEPYRMDEGSSSGEESYSQSDGWWGGTGSGTDSSCSSSSCFASDSGSGSELDWELAVDPRGELFYVESNPLEKQEHDNDGPTEKSVSPKYLGTLRRNRHTARGKLVQFIRRRNSKRRLNKTVATAEAQPAQTSACEVPNIRATTINKVTFQDWQEGEVREVSIAVDPRGRHNLGRRATFCETLLGLVISTFADETRIMVAGFIPNGEAIKHRSIKIGDWLRSVDGQEVTFQTIDSVLAKFTTPTKVELKLQRVAGCDVTAQLSVESPPKGVQQSDLVKQLLGMSGEDELSGVLRELPVGVLYLTQEGLTEGGPEDQGVLYCYPPPLQKNTIGSARGAFLTLHHLLPDLAPSPPVSSTVLLHDQLTHVVYTPQGKELMLLAVPDNRCPLREAVQVTADLVRNLQFNYQTLSRAFTHQDNRPALDHFFSLFFARLLSSGLWPSAKQSVLLQEISTKAAHPAPAQFEDLLPAAHWVPLPREAQAQIDEALSELEANDFGDLSEDSSGCQRLYTIIGTCVYHKGYLLASHLARTDLVDVHTFCRQQGLLHLGRSEPVRSLVLWREVFPASCNRGLVEPVVPYTPTNTSPYQPPQGRWFLLIVGKGQEMLVVLLESGGCTVRLEGCTGPDICYVEQAQDTLAYIQKLGIPTIAAKWLASGRRPQVIAPELVPVRKTSPRRTDNLLGFVRSTDSSTPTKLTSLGGSTLSLGSPHSKKPPEVTSILKRRPSPDRGSGFQASGCSLQGSTSEDSASQAASVVSEVSDEAAPILGRRAERERSSHRGSDTSATPSRLTDSHSDHSDDSDSDWELHRNQNQQRSQSSTFDLSDMTQSLLNDVGDVLPSKLTAGDGNILFHYVHLDFTEGILLCPPVNREQVQSEKLQEILHHFRRSCQVIHDLLHNAVRFKKLMGQEISRSLINKSLIAIKEHGVLFECSPYDGESSKKSSMPLAYWVVGRLFFTPHPREVYVCYHDSAPQNMVEIAFRLGLSASG